MTDHPTSSEWTCARWLGTGPICGVSGYQSLMFEAADGSRIRLLLEPNCAKHIRESLSETQGKRAEFSTLPHWLMSSEILQHAGLKDFVHSTDSPVISSIATIGDFT